MCWRTLTNPPKPSSNTLSRLSSVGEGGRLWSPSLQWAFSCCPLSSLYHPFPTSENQVEVGSSHRQRGRAQTTPEPGLQILIGVYLMPAGLLSWNVNSVGTWESGGLRTLDSVKARVCPALRLAFPLGLSALSTTCLPAGSFFFAMPVPC